MIEQFPLVSVVTPCLNPGDRLVQCIESIARQTYPHVEHIIIDGGSTDGTKDRLERVTGVSHISEPDRGQSDALSKGFAIAKGAVFTWLNDDDVLHPHAVESAVATMLREGVGWVYANCEMRRGGRTTVWRSPSRLRRSSFDTRNVIPQQGCFFAAEAYHHVGGMDTSLHLAMDFDLWIRLLDAGVRSAYIDDVLSVFDTHPMSKTGSVPSSRFLEEKALVLARRGRGRAAASMLGQAAARKVREENRTLTLRNLRAQANAMTFQSEIATKPSRWAVRAGAYADAALGRPEPWVVHRTLGLIPTVWFCRETRRLLLDRFLERRRRFAGAHPAESETRGSRSSNSRSDSSQSSPKSANR